MSVIGGAFCGDTRSVCGVCFICSVRDDPLLWDELELVSMLSARSSLYCELAKLVVNWAAGTGADDGIIERCCWATGLRGGDVVTTGVDLLSFLDMEKVVPWVVGWWVAVAGVLEPSVGALLFWSRR